MFLIFNYILVSICHLNRAQKGDWQYLISNRGMNLSLLIQNTYLILNIMQWSAKYLSAP